MVRRVLSDAGRDDLLEPAQLLVSEVVTNALVHSGTPIDVAMAAGEEGVLVEVGDGSLHTPRPRHYASTASTGRGLALLDQTADSWGVVPGIRGKTVWFQLSSAEDAEHPPDPTNGADPAGAGNAAPRSGEQTVTVQLLNAPLLLHAAWQQHAEAVLREHLLAGMDGETGPDPFAVHAMAVDALAVLAEQIPRPSVGVQPDEVMATAVDPHVSSPRVELSVPRGSLPHFRVLDTIMRTAQGMGERGELLVPVVQPEMRMLRRWLCGEVLSQSEGVAPVPWPPEVSQAPARRDLAWDSGAVTGSAQAVIAADDTDLVAAVSASALELLGYADADELVGHRLISIIPPRYRQAHLAGFTLHLLTGRGPLLAGPVKVPVLRRDETEQWVELSVDAQRVADGRSVFVATLREVSEHGA
jgi:PAS domain S-box-containing protein